ATGSTARAALRALRARDPARLILAVPVASPEGAAALRPETDDLIALHEPAAFMAVGQWYDEFDQLTDEEVLGALRAHQP
ncbi:phosphoribosyltransferase, partial [Actinospica acidiphila]